jgi:hypothetical protein
MAGRGRVPAVAIELSDWEREELEGLSRRRRTAQGLARRAQIGAGGGRGGSRTNRSPRAWVRTRRRSASGVGRHTPRPAFGASSSTSTQSVEYRRYAQPARPAADVDPIGREDLGD